MVNCNVNQNWHNSRTFNNEVLQYHDKYARQPNVISEKAKLESLKHEIKSQMNNIGIFTCLEFKYKGSTYERVKIMHSVRDCPEFDLDFVIKGGEYLKVDNLCFSSWHTLRLKNGASNVPQIISWAQENGVLKPITVLELFYGSLSRCAFIKDYNIKLRYHGPSVQMDVRNPSNNKLWFQVDLAPAFYLERNNPYESFSECYMAKSPDGEYFRNMWYRSYSTEEKRLMDTASGERKVVLRTLKAMRTNSSQLLGLQSYHIKTALFHVMDEFRNDSYWTGDKIGQRLIDVLFYIKNCLEKGEMLNYFNKDLNILKLGYEARYKLGNQIAILIENEQRMLDFLGDRENNNHYHNLSKQSLETEASNCWMCLICFLFVGVLIVIVFGSCYFL